MDGALYRNYVKILQQELLVAMGCTEPIAIAYAGAKAREVLGMVPEHCVVRCSGNIIKNVKGVVVPHSGGRRGIDIAAAIGILGGDAEKQLDVLENISPDIPDLAAKRIQEGFCKCELVEGVENLYIDITVCAGSDRAQVIIQDYHTNITKIVKNGGVIFERQASHNSQQETADKSLLNVHDIIEFADSLQIEDIQETLERQIRMNSAISEEGLKNPWGARVGQTILKGAGQKDRKQQACAAAAAGSDARMAGCPLPVVINSGSGNQGITVTLPILVYAREEHISNDRLYRALALANLISIHQKKYIGSLSAYCGAVSAACAAACGIAYLLGDGQDLVEATITNTIPVVGGMICDGAKASCAAKIASALYAALTGWEMARNGFVFQSGEGLVADRVEKTIMNLGRVGRDGMKETDLTVLNIMLGQ